MSDTRLGSDGKSRGNNTVTKRRQVDKFAAPVTRSTRRAAAAAPVSQAKYAVKEEVSWERNNLPDGVGLVTDVKIEGSETFYKVREAGGNVFVFREDSLTTRNGK